MAAKIPKVVVAGPSYTDMAIQCEGTPEPGKYVKGLGFSYNPWGSGPNQAIEAALCGCSVSLVSCIGKDCFGENIRANLLKFGVNTDNLFVTEAKNTGTIFTLVDNNGENTGCVSEGANSAFTVEHASCASVEGVITDANCCLINDYNDREAIISLIRNTEMHHTNSILDIKFSPRNHSDEIESWPQDFFNVDVMICEPDPSLNEDSTGLVHELKMIATDIVARGVNTVIMRCGRRGCLIASREFNEVIEPLEPELVPMSCGRDAFLGAIAACSAVGDDAKRATKFAMVAELIACQRTPTQENLPKKSEILELLL